MYENLIVKEISDCYINVVKTLAVLENVLL